MHYESSNIFRFTTHFNVPCLNSSITDYLGNCGGVDCLYLPYGECALLPGVPAGLLTGVLTLGIGEFLSVNCVFILVRLR